jgi:anti-sigma factor RsiW
MTSDRDRKLIGLYLDGELAPIRAVELERRIASSPELRAELDAQRKLKERVATTGPRLTDAHFEGFSAKVAQKLRESSESGERVVFRAPTNPVVFRYATATIAAVLLVSLLSFSYFFKKPSDTRSVRIIEVEVADGTKMGVYTPENARHTVIRLSPPVDPVQVTHVETADGYDYEVSTNTGSKSVTIRLNPVDEDEETPEE